MKLKKEKLLYLLKIQNVIIIIHIFIIVNKTVVFDLDETLIHCNEI